MSAEIINYELLILLNLSSPSSVCVINFILLIVNVMLSSSFIGAILTPRLQSSSFPIKVGFRFGLFALRTFSHASNLSTWS